jgi:hypothetical protein
MNSLIKKPLSNIDLEKLYQDMNKELNENKKMNIYTVPQIEADPQKFMNDLHENRYCILFISRNRRIGHWVCVIEADPSKKIYFFDSYGKSPTEYDFYDSLVKFFKEYIPKIEYNTEQYQKLQEGINTCGRWSMLIIGFNRIIKNFNPAKFKKIMNDIKKNSNKSYDEIVAGLINDKI